MGGSAKPTCNSLAFPIATTFVSMGGSCVLAAIFFFFLSNGTNGNEAERGFVRYSATRFSSAHHLFLAVVKALLLTSLLVLVPFESLKLFLIYHPLIWCHPYLVSYLSRALHVVCLYYYLASPSQIFSFVF